MELKRKTIKEVLDHFKFRATHYQDISELNIRIYLEVKEESYSFNFLILEWVESITEGNEFEDLDNTKVEVVIHGNAYFDGIRHMFFGSDFTDNEGYFYYPHLNDIIKLMTELRRLEEKYCRDLD